MRTTTAGILLIGTSVICLSARAGRIEDVKDAVRAKCQTEIPVEELPTAVKRAYECEPDQNVTVTGCKIRCLKSSFVLIRNAKNPTASLSKADLKAMALGKKKTWDRGVPVQLVLGPAGSPALTFFADPLLGFQEAALTSKIKQEVFKGEMRKPITAGDDKDCISAVSQDIGAIGVISGGAARSLPDTVTVIEIH